MICSSRVVALGGGNEMTLPPSQPHESQQRLTHLDDLWQMMLPAVVHAGAAAGRREAEQREAGVGGGGRLPASWQWRQLLLGACRIGSYAENRGFHNPRVSGSTAHPSLW